MRIFRFLHYGLAVILVLVGIKMLLADHFDIPIHVMLVSVAAVLLISIALSMAFRFKATKQNP